MLSGTIHDQLFQLIAGNCREIMKTLRCVNLPKLPQRHSLNFSWYPSGKLAIEKTGRLAVAKAPDHA